MPRLGSLLNEEEIMLGFGLIGFASSNFADGPEDRKSVTGYCFFIAGALVTCSSKIPTYHVRVHYQAEYVLGYASREGV